MKYLLIILILASCYNERKATSQFSRAAVAYPSIPTEYCATTFPSKDSTIRDTTLVSDTLYIEGEITTDTLLVNDTVRIIITNTLPGKTITNTIRIVDTIYRENTAAVAACKIDNSNLAASLLQRTNEYNKATGQARKRGYIMWGLIALIAAVLGLKAYQTFSKPKI